MSDPRSLLERESQRFTQTDGAFERLVRRRDRRHRNQRIEAGLLGVVIAIAVGWVGVNTIRSAPSVPADPPSENLAPSPTGPVSGEPVLYLRSFRSQDVVELTVYADGWVLWEPSDRPGYLTMRLTPKGVEWLSSKAASTGLFEHDQALGLDRGWGHIEVRRGDRSVIVGWGKTPNQVSALGMQDRFLEATPAQADELSDLETFLRDPVGWALPPDMYVRSEVSPFVPTHLWVSWDRNTPDPSQLPSPAREVLTSNLEAVLDGRCELISIAQALEIARAMEQAGLIEPEDVTDGIAFDMPGQGGSVSFLHAHPALPHASTCD